MCWGHFYADSLILPSQQPCQIGTIIIFTGEKTSCEEETRSRGRNGEAVSEQKWLCRSRAKAADSGLILVLPQEPPLP